MAGRRVADSEDVSDSGGDSDEYVSDEDLSSQNPRSSAGLFASLSTGDRAAASQWQRPTTVDDQTEAEPLSREHQTTSSGLPLLAAHTFRYAADGKLEGLSAALSRDGRYLAVAYRNGTIALVNAVTMEAMRTLNPGAETTSAAGSAHAEAGLPGTEACTCVKFRPSGGAAVAAGSSSSSSSSGGGLQNVLLASAGRHLHHIHVGSGKVMHSVEEEGNAINVVDIRHDGEMYATAGSDHAVRVYAEQTHQLVTTLRHGDGASTAGHSNTVHALCWRREDYQVLLSGGWDKTVQVWDLRAGKSVRSIFGPYICGDALDTCGAKVLTGSWRHDAPLQLWDFRSGGLLTNLPFHQPEPDACLVYAAKFGRGELEGMVFAGGSGRQPLLRSYFATGHLHGTYKAPSAVHSLDVLASGGGGPTGTNKLVAACCAFQLDLLRL